MEILTKKGHKEVISGELEMIWVVTWIYILYNICLYIIYYIIYLYIHVYIYKSGKIKECHIENYKIAERNLGMEDMPCAMLVDRETYNQIDFNLPKIDRKFQYNSNLN